MMDVQTKSLIGYETKELGGQHKSGGNLEETPEK